MLKGAVIQLTPKTEAVRDSSAPVVPHDNTLPLAQEDRGWSYDVRQLQVADSVLFFQHESGEQVTVRDIRLQMEQDENHRATVDFSGRVNRDQRDLALNFSATVQGGDYPHSLKADFTQLSWQLRGAELPPDGINGQGSLQASWQEDDKTLRFDNLNLMANRSTVTGSGSVVLGIARTGRWICTPPLSISIVCWRKGRRRRTVAPVSRARVRRDRCAR